MDLFSSLKENFRRFLFNSVATGRSLKNLSYLSSFSLSQRLRFWRISSNMSRSIESNIVYTKLSGAVFQHILQSWWHPTNSSMPQNKRNFSLLISNKSVLSLCYGTIWCSQQSYRLMYHQRMIQEVWEGSLYRLFY